MNRQVVTVTPSAWSNRGSAVAFSPNGQPLDVWSGIVGETCRVEITHHGMNRARGYFLEPVGAPHRLRRQSPSQPYHISGSCPLMHMTEEGQHQAKLAIIRDAFAEWEFEDATPESVVSSPDGEWGYRHTVKLVYGRTEQGSPRLGAYARGTNRIVMISDSEVVTDVLRSCMRSIAHHLIDEDIWPYDTETRRGLLRHVVMRQSRASGQVLVTLVCTRKDKCLKNLATIIQNAIPPVSGVKLHVNDKPGNSIYCRDEDGEIWTRNLVGKPFIEDTIGGHVLRIGGGDFFQVNPSVANVMCDDLLAEFEPHRQRPVLDLYCGVGSFTMSLAKQHGWALGIEVVQGAIYRAKDSARLNHVPAEFLAGTVGEVLPAALARVAGKAPLVVLNPARKGLEPEVALKVLACEPIKIAYVSCNPKALARDLKEFSTRGWKIDTIKAYDMLPQTSHVELIAMLSPVNAPTPSGRSPRRKIVRG